MSNRSHRWARPRCNLAVVCAAIMWMMAVTLAEAAPAPFRLTLEPDFVTLFEGEYPVFRYVRGEILAPGRRKTGAGALTSIPSTPWTACP